MSTPIPALGHKPAPRHEGSDFDCEQITVAQLHARAVAREAAVYHAELTDDGKFVASVFVITDQKRAQQLLAASRAIDGKEAKS
jgi:hypothetical protein